jgi:hypothetical protein
MVEDLIDGTMKIRHGKLLLSFHEIDKKPVSTPFFFVPFSPV